MKVYYIGVFRRDPEPTFELCSQTDLSSFGYFQQTPVSEFMSLFARAIAESKDLTPRQEVAEQSYVFYVYKRSEGIVSVVITDQEYPKQVAHKLLSQVSDDFLTTYTRAKWSQAGKLPLPVLGEYIVKYQDPKQADSMLRIQQELDETKIVLHKTIESVLERGEKIDNLVARSEGLSSSSKMFYTQAKKQNSCCVIT
ncbi:uncharacterized protein LAJ45_00283 [Morchella importuna]|uniref:Synaptobrevin homolog YKT6 n=1 Tax=Morchella conica CCBAS932 TaxID=1392247 RepID=A0A3N4KMM8_9PEZI|nr:uncharacterized protein LAJ45_00283 [Morchella importuna]KAH8155273.1 hypothetical protein LAJ45_00283 [Morchella importuna]RPB11750.1 snare-like protein [Morchella conica CCBAS932]